MEIGVIQHNSKTYRQMLNLRIKVLLNPIGVPATFIQPEKEKNDFLIGAFNASEMIGCCVLTPIDTNTVQLRQMAVDDAWQSKGVGASIVTFAEKLSREKGFKNILLHARSAVVPFYIKSGYIISGDAFEEVGIEHRLMLKSLT